MATMHDEVKYNETSNINEITVLYNGAIQPVADRTRSQMAKVLKRSLNLPSIGKVFNHNTLPTHMIKGIIIIYGE